MIELYQKERTFMESYQPVIYLKILSQSVNYVRRLKDGLCTLGIFRKHSFGNTYSVKRRDSTMGSLNFKEIVMYKICSICIGHTGPLKFE